MENQITLGAFVAFTLYMGMLVWPSIALGWVVGIFQQGAASMERINVILDTVPEIKDDEHVSPKSEVYGKIEFKDLTFSYSTDVQPVLKNISFSIDAGKILAIVGRTGSGKTTILNTLNRIYDPPRDTVFIDDTDIRKIGLDVLHKNIGYVPQETFLFSDTISENIVFGNPDTDNKEVEKSAQIAQIYESVLDFPDQFDTILGERGINLSGGQKQRVAIARAIIRDPRILILDDSLSAVDTITEEKILDQLKHVMAHRTCIWISHRISAIRNADKIIVLDEGEIAEEGTHSELLAFGGIYAELYEKQQLEEKLELVE